MKIKKVTGHAVLRHVAWSFAYGLAVMREDRACGHPVTIWSRPIMMENRDTLRKFRAAFGRSLGKVIADTLAEYRRKSIYILSVDELCGIRAIQIDKDGRYTVIPRPVGGAS